MGYGFREGDGGDTPAPIRTDAQAYGARRLGAGLSEPAVAQRGFKRSCLNGFDGVSDVNGVNGVFQRAGRR